MTAAIQLRTTDRFARILGVGQYRPARVVSNAEIIDKIDSSDEWIRERSGIIERRMAAHDETVVDMSAAAAEKALADSGVAPEAIGLVLVATVTHLLQTPSAAALVADRIGASNAAAMDVSAACAGFCHGVALANDAVRTGTADHVLLVGCEKLTEMVDAYDRSTAFLFGDGAGAVVIGPSDTVGIGPVVWGADGSQGDAITQNAPWDALRDDPEHPFPALSMNGPAVFRWAVFEMSRAAQQALDAAGVSAQDLDVFIPHQANMRIIDSMVKKLDLPERVVVARDIAHTGNTSAASIPLAMAALLESGQAKSGDTALLIGFGAGLSYAAQVVALP